MTDEHYSFEEIFEQNKRRIHYHIHKLNIRDPHQDFFQEGLVALWNAYETHQPDKGPMATYFNFIIRNRLIDKVRQESRHQDNKEKLIHNRKIDMENGNRFRRTETDYPLVEVKDLPIEDGHMWQTLKNNLTANQWKWVDYFIVKELPVKDIAYLENKSEDAVKSWGKQVRKKLRDEDFRKRIGLDVED